MMARHLHELLKEDQEPFLLNKYISDRRSQLTKRPSPSTTLQLKKPKPIHHHNSSFSPDFCKNACFFSFRNTPDLLSSPFLEFASPVKSPCKSPNAIFLHIPSRTAALLLEAALRVQRHPSSSKSKTHNKTNGFGLFRSLVKRLTPRSRKREIQDGGGDRSKKNEEQMVSNDQVGFPCSYNGRPSSAVWSETNEDKSLDMETSSSTSYSDESHDIDLLSESNQKHVTDCVCCDHDFCESPFRFVLRSSPSSGHQTPELMSPSRPRAEDKEKDGTESVEKSQLREEEEEKEQCSPVSVLDQPFENDDEGHENINEDDGFDLECSYAALQRAKQQLLYKLRSFEKLAELDPIELEKRMLEEEEEEADETPEEKDYNRLVLEVICQSSTHERRGIPEDHKRLISDLIVEEERELNSLEERETVIRREDDGWKKNEEHKEEVAGELELAILGLLVEEFSEELVMRLLSCVLQYHDFGLTSMGTSAPIGVNKSAMSTPQPMPFCCSLSSHPKPHFHTFPPTQQPKLVWNSHWSF
ncbi:uncharacterized protein LOC114726039 [Neltuma alba]|uniref:uncharacterized protein LOC114726039 n=1 Tax=Neltuma alba TaxID=207710 RepID=UPI0010A41123|nr:uncharacterized protein LOC114726039 [Prosopis alba]